MRSSAASGGAAITIRSAPWIARAGESAASSISSSARATAGPPPVGLHAAIVQSSGLRRSA